MIYLFQKIKKRQHNKDYHMNDATLHFLHHVELPPSLSQVIQAVIDCDKRQAAHHCFDRAQCRGYQQSRVSKKGGNR